MAVKHLFAVLVLVVLAILSAITGYSAVMLSLFIAAILLCVYFAYKNEEWGIYGVISVISSFILFLVISQSFHGSADLFLVIWISCMAYFALMYHPTTTESVI